MKLKSILNKLNPEVRKEDIVDQGPLNNAAWQHWLTCYAIRRNETFQRILATLGAPLPPL